MIMSHCSTKNKHCDCLNTTQHTARLIDIYADVLSERYDGKEAISHDEAMVCSRIAKARLEDEITCNRRAFDGAKWKLK